MIVELNQFTIKDLMTRSFQKFESLDALATVGEKPLTYQAVQSQVHENAVRLLSLNIQKGQRVAVLGENCPNWVIAYLAAVTIGAVAVPILTGFPEEDVRHIIRNSNVAAIFVSDKLRPAVEEMENSPLQAIISMEDMSVTPVKKPGANPVEKVRKKLEGKIENSDILSQFPGPDPADLAAIIYTSGTTGHSKGVMLTHLNIVSDVVNAIEKFPIDSNDRFLSILPLAHTFEATGGLLCPLAVGVSIFYLKGLPTPQKLLSAMAQVNPTGVLTVPLVVDKIFRKKILPQLQGKAVTRALYRLPLFRKLLHKVAGKKLIQSFGGQLRFFMFGGAALNEDVEQFLRDAAISYSTGYGMTETSPILTINPFGRVKMGSCGQPIPGIEIKIDNPDPETLIGQIVVRGPIVMQGYYKNPEATEQILKENGWLHTGDLGYFDNEGYLFIKGRSKNVLVGPSGENIYPEIIEQQYLTSPYIQEIVVYQYQGKLVAKCYLDQDVLDQEFGLSGLPEKEAADKISEILENTRHEMNATLPAFSGVNAMTIQPEPFEKTPTKKVKRYLYIPE